MTAVLLDHDRLKSAVTQLPPDTLSELRQRALERFVSYGFPSTRDEDWRYTNLGAAAEISNGWLSDRADITPAIVPAAVPDTGFDAYWIVISDGIVDRKALAALANKLPSSVSVQALSDAEDPSAVYIEDSIASFNAALLRDGIRVRIASGATLDKPIGLYVVDSATDGAILSHVRIVIDMGTDSAATFVQIDQSSGPEQHFATSVVELRMADGANVDYLRLQDRADNHIQTGALRAQLGTRAVLRHGAVDTGGRLVRHDLRIELAGERSSATLAGAYFADGRQHIDNHLFADHLVGPATSRQEYRGIAAGRSRCVFNGKAVVRPHADGTDAVQSNHNLLLSDHAEIDTKPELEIYADDVKCSHGATVGQLDEKAMFYLRSRGLGRDEAAMLLTRAFAATVLSALPVPAARDYVDRLVERKLDAMTGGDR